MLLYEKEIGINRYLFLGSVSFNLSFCLKLKIAKGMFDIFQSVSPFQNFFKSVFSD